jgi:hypothetical protein
MTQLAGINGLPMTLWRLCMKPKGWLLLCLFLSINDKTQAAVAAIQTSTLIIEFGTRAEMLKTDGTGGTYSYETKYFKSSGSFSLEITRDPAFNALGKVDFHIDVISLSSPERSFADRIMTQSGNEKSVAAIPLPRGGPYLVRVRLDGEVKKMMEGQLFPARSNPPLPSTSFVMQVKGNMDGGGISPTDKQSFDQLALRLSSCDLDAATRRESADLESISSVRSAAALTKVATIKLFGAGQEIYIDIPLAWREPGRNVYMKVEAKRFDDSNYRSVCSPFLLSHTGGYVLARLVTQGEWLDWRVETRFTSTDAPFRSEEPITLNRERFLSPPPMFAAGTDFDRTLAFLCFDRKTSEVAPSGTTDFAKSFHLDVQVREQSFRLSKAQLQEIEKLSLVAATTWNRACVNCQPLNLSIITINEKNFAHSAVGQWVSSKIALPLNAEYLEKSLGVAKGRNRIGTFGISFPYLAIGDLQEEFKDICKLQESSSQVNLATLKRQVCNDASRDDQFTSHILIDFVNGKTACGESPNIIACRADTELTEFNVRDFKFVSPDASAPSMGNGEIEVDFSHVLLHEMGHWIGLAHIDSGDSVMASSLEQSRCIDAATVEGLSRVVASKVGDEALPLAFTLEKRH